MKFHWGHGILVVLILIVVTFSTALILSFTDEKDHQLITENYYAKELAFQDQIDRGNNAKSDGKNLVAQQTEKGLEVAISPAPSSLDTSQVLLIRPSDELLDITSSLNNKGEVVLAAEEIRRGKYILQVSWTESGKDFYLEKDLFIQ
jgi:hypothetical protein